jgi:hypothetical protein
MSERKFDLGQFANLVLKPAHEFLILFPAWVDPGSSGRTIAAESPPGVICSVVRPRFLGNEIIPS